MKHKQGKSFWNDRFQRPSMYTLQHQQYHVINFIIDKKCISKALGLHYPWIAQNLSTLQRISYLLLFALGFLKANCNIHDCKRTLYKIHLTYWRNLVNTLSMTHSESRIIVIPSILKEYWILMYLQKLKFSLLPLVIEIQKNCCLQINFRQPSIIYSFYF